VDRVHLPGRAAAVRVSVPVVGGWAGDAVEGQATGDDGEAAASEVFRKHPDDGWRGGGVGLELV